MAARITIEIKGKDPKQIAAEKAAALSQAPVRAMKRIGDGAQADYRGQIVSAGLGARMGNAIRADVYPNKGTDAAVRVYPKPIKAAQIVAAFDQGLTIYPKHGQRYLAIPTENVPKGRQFVGGHASPTEVEAIYNQDLSFARTGKGEIVAYIDAVRGKNGKGYRRATRGRIKEGRDVETVVMFIMIPYSRLRKTLNVDAIRSRWTRLGPEIMVEEFEANADRRGL